MSDDLMRTVRDILLPMCKHCGSRECGPYRCRFADPGTVVVRGVKFRDEDDAYDAMVQREVDGE
jgi:hypothetical protein